MTDDAKHHFDWQTQDKVAGIAFLIGVIAGLFLFALFLDDRITSSWGDWLGQGFAMILGVVTAAAVLIPVMSAKPKSLSVLRGAANGILLIASVWGTASAAAYWGSERLASAVWLMSLGGFGFLLQTLFAPNQKSGCWAALYIAFFLLGGAAAITELTASVENSSTGAKNAAATVVQAREKSESGSQVVKRTIDAVSYTHLRAHETVVRISDAVFVL